MYMILCLAPSPHVSPLQCLLLMNIWVISTALDILVAVFSTHMDVFLLGIYLGGKLLTPWYPCVHFKYKLPSIFLPTFFSECLLSDHILRVTHTKQQCWAWSLCSEADLLTTSPHCPPMFLRTKTLVYNRKLCVFCNVNLQKRSPELRGTGHSIMCNGHVCSSLQKETLPLTSKVVCYSNILEMIIWRKGSQCLCSQNVQKCERP